MKFCVDCCAPAWRALHNKPLEEQRCAHCYPLFEARREFGEIAAGMHVNLRMDAYGWVGNFYTLEAPAGKVFKANGRREFKALWRLANKPLSCVNYLAMVRILRCGLENRRTQ